MLGAVTSSANASSAASNSQLDVGIEDFLKILVSQLNYQDPLEPLENQEFVSQIAQFTALEQSRQVSEKLDSLVQVQGVTQSIGLIGRDVQLAAGIGAGAGQTGTVKAIEFVDGQPLLTITTTNGLSLNRVSISQVILVR